MSDLNYAKTFLAQSIEFNKAKAVFDLDLNFL